MGTKNVGLCSGVASLIQIGVVEGEAARVKWVEIEVVEEVVESVGAVPIASRPFVPPLLQLVRLCLFYPEAYLSKKTKHRRRQHEARDSTQTKHAH